MTLLLGTYSGHGHKSGTITKRFYGCQLCGSRGNSIGEFEQSTPEPELDRAWRLIEVARGKVRQYAAFRSVSTEPPKVTEKPEPEFTSLLGPRQRCPMSGLSRSTLYELASRGKIRMISLRREGNSRGKRLIQIDSVRNYPRTLDAQQNPPSRDSHVSSLLGVAR